MNWTNVEHCTPWTDEEVLCKVKGMKDTEYLVARYIDGDWFVRSIGHIASYTALPDDVVIKWCHIHE